MAEQTTWAYSDNGEHDNEIQPGEGLFFSSEANRIAPLEVGVAPAYTIVAPLNLRSITALANNNAWSSPNLISVNGGTPAAISTSVAQGDTTLKVTWLDDAGNTALSNVALFVHDPNDQAAAPSGVTAYAFERTASAIRSSHNEGSSDGNAWETGINGSANALDMENKASAASHDFYIGICLVPSSVGKHLNARMTMSFDVA